MGGYPVFSFSFPFPFFFFFCFSVLGVLCG